MSTSIKVAWDCECNPSSTTGYISGDNDTVYCNKCDGVIADVSELKLGDMLPIEHSRYDFEHYKNCQACAEDHQDFIEDMRQDALLDAIEESDNG